MRLRYLSILGCFCILSSFSIGQDRFFLPCDSAFSGEIIYSISYTNSPFSSSEQQLLPDTLQITFSSNAFQLEMRKDRMLLETYYWHSQHDSLLYWLPANTNTWFVSPITPDSLRQAPMRQAQSKSTTYHFSNDVGSEAIFTVRDTCPIALPEASSKPKGISPLLAAFAYGVPETIYLVRANKQQLRFTYIRKAPLSLPTPDKLEEAILFNEKADFPGLR